MIGHFIRQDIRTFRFYWVIAFIATVVCSAVLAFKWKPEVLFILGGLYFYLWLFQLQALVGFKWRSQHQMSRNYYLALPVNRKKLFFIIQCRGLALACPLMVLMAVVAYIGPEGATHLPVHVWLSQPLFVLLFAYAGMVWLLNMMIDGTLQWERISSYLSVSQRAWEYVKLVLIQLGEMFVVFVAIKFLLATAPFVVLAVVVGVVVFRYFRTRNLWIGV